jgi:hypothetical protein
LFLLKTTQPEAEPNGVRRAEVYNYDCTAGVLNECTAGGDVNKNSIDADLIELFAKIVFDSTKSGALLNTTDLFSALFVNPFTN